MRLDYVGIVVQIVGSFIPGIYFAFYCEPQLQKVYWSMVCLFPFPPPRHPLAAKVGICFKDLVLTFGDTDYYAGNYDCDNCS